MEKAGGGPPQRAQLERLTKEAFTFKMVKAQAVLSQSSAAR